ncbi:MAG: hypothetical protein IJ460_00200 [Clostridia bacterium]|nr:hypothetical protein [Clostridia bacterium]
MKKLLSIFCAAALAITPLGIIAQDTENTQIQTVDAGSLSVAEKLLGAITDEIPFVGETVTRGEFVDAVAKIMLVDNGVTAEVLYNDVPIDNTYAVGITAAAKMGWISPADKFNPTNEIGINEAIKIVISAVNYGERAMYNGGYPNGYILEANRLELLEGVVNTDTTLKPDQARVMLYNMLRVNKLDAVYTEGQNGSSTVYESSDEPILSVLYDITETEGIVNETPYNSYSYGSSVYTKEMYISIDGNRYKYADATYDLLGRNVRAFVKDSDNTVVAMETEENNNIFTCSLYDLNMNGTAIEYCSDNNSKVKNLKWNGGIAVYNGRTIKNLTAAYFDMDGYAEFIDNDDDNVYEVVHITAYRYVTVGNIDRINRRIGDVNSEENSLDFSQCEDEAITFYDADGAEMSVYGLESGMVLAAVAPEDMSFGKVYVVDKTVKGVVTSIGDDFFEIGENEYRTTNYFEAYDSNEILPGVTYQFYIGYDGRIITTGSTSAKYEYGYIIDAIVESGMNDTVLVKIYGSDGKMLIAEADDKLFVDKIEIKDEAEALSTIKNLIADEINRVVRYKMNSEGLLSKLDFPAEYDYKKYDALTADEDNKLVYYPEYYKSLRYRSSSKIFNGDVYVGKAACFMIPDDIDEEEKYFKAGVSGSVLSHDMDYKPHIYDIDEYGAAGAVVVRGKNEILTSSDGSYIIEEIRSALDDEGVQMKLVSCWYAGKIYKFYLPDDVAVVKDSGSELEPGDIIRVKLDAENHIYKLQVDFDYGSFAKNSTLASGNYQSKLVSVSYWDGIAYSYDRNSSMLQLSNKTDEYGEADFSAYSLNTLNANTSNIVSFDCESHKARPVTRDEIKTYREFGENCDYIVMRTDYDSCRAIIIYSGYRDR